MPGPDAPFDTKALIAALESLLHALPTTSNVDTSNVPAATRKRLRVEIERAIAGLQIIMSSLDPIRLPPHVLDPSDPDVVGRLIAETLLVQERHALGGTLKFYGSGVYALYYSGQFEAYQSLVGSETPVYIGKADPATHGAVSPIEQGTRLWTRLYDHHRSISAAERDPSHTLQLTDFDCRFLVVRSAWQGTSESYLIDRFQPIWNNEVGICYGFGKHGDDPSTRSNTRSPWDTLHPGRRWAWKAGNQPYQKSPEDIMMQIAEHFRRNPPK